ncbi:MAG: ribosome silencing factor [Bacteroidota bacterium]|nr:ribosome silencing factor [Bacteroidota bacterium]
MTPKILAKIIANLTLTKKAHGVIIMDLKKITDITDYFVLCSADSDTQVKAIADAVIDGTDEIGMPAWRTEGLTQRQWIIIDFIDVVVHVFLNEARHFYNLEKLWGDAKIETVVDKPPAPKPKTTKTTKKKIERKSKK